MNAGTYPRALSASRHRTLGLGLVLLRVLELLRCRHVRLHALPIGYRQVVDEGPRQAPHVRRASIVVVVLSQEVRVPLRTCLVTLILTTAIHESPKLIAPHTSTNPHTHTHSACASASTHAHAQTCSHDCTHARLHECIGQDPASPDCLGRVRPRRLWLPAPLEACPRSAPRSRT